MRNKKLLIVILFFASALRLWKLDKVPISLFSDELDVGYQAYSILKTGKDYFGNAWPLHFQSYVEYRAPLYIYSAVPTVAIFGITFYGIRLPAAIFGIMGVWMMYLSVKEMIKHSKIKEKIYLDNLPLAAALMMAFSPWHIHYSRAAFEVSELVLLILCAMYFFFKSFENPKFLWISALFMGLAPWTYSTAKLFVPVLALFLLLVWYKDLLKFPKKYLIRAALTLLVLGLPLVYVVLCGGGAQRFNKISVLGDESIVSEVNFARLNDAYVNNAHGGGILLKIISRLVNNKYLYAGSIIITNYFESFSTQFLFLRGDVSLRHSVIGMGQFYKFEAIFLLLGVHLFFRSNFNKKIKYLIFFWILFGAVPSSLTIEGGGHATRLILILSPMIFLMSFGLVEIVRLIKNKFNKKIIILCYFTALFISFFLYQYNYWVRFPWYSEKSWHSGFREVVDAIREYENQYDKIVITNAEERPYIFLAAYYNYAPSLWQRGFQEGYVAGFGDLKKIGNFYFGQVEGTIGIKKLSEVMNEKTLYVASQRELDLNLILEPQKIPKGLHLVKAIGFPSGEPAFYLLGKAKI